MGLGALAVGLGLGLKYKATLDEGKEAAKQAKFAQEQLNEEAKAVESAGQYQSREKRKEAKRFQAKQIAAMSANGGLLTGSNLLLLADTAYEFEGDALVINRNFKVKATGLRNQGALIRYRGRLARRSARIRGATDLGIGIGTLALMAKKAASPPPGGAA